MERLGERLSLCFRSARAHLLAARQLNREFDRESAILELDHAIELVRRGAPLSGSGSPDPRRLKSRLFESSLLVVDTTRHDRRLAQRVLGVFRHVGRSLVLSSPQDGIIVRL